MCSFNFCWIYLFPVSTAATFITAICFLFNFFLLLLSESTFTVAAAAAATAVEKNSRKGQEQQTLRGWAVWGWGGGVSTGL